MPRTRATFTRSRSSVRPSINNGKRSIPSVPQPQLFKRYWLVRSTTDLTVLVYRVKATVYKNNTWTYTFYGRTALGIEIGQQYLYRVNSEGQPFQGPDNVPCTCP